MFALLLWRSSRLQLSILMVASVFGFFFLIVPVGNFNVGWAWINLGGGAVRTVYSFCAGILLFRVLPINRRQSSYISILPVVCVAGIVGLAAPKNYQVYWEIFCSRLDFSAVRVFRMPA